MNQYVMHLVINTQNIIAIISNKQIDVVAESGICGIPDNQDLAVIIPTTAMIVPTIAACVHLHAHCSLGVHELTFPFAHL